MNPTYRATMLAGVSLCALLAAGPAPAQQSANERVYRQEALTRARAVTTAWRRLESYILGGSAGTPDPQGTSVSGWSGEVPPAGSGWLADWTLRGVRARYCQDTLLVYLAPERLKGVGRDHRAVQAAQPESKPLGIRPCRRTHHRASDAHRDGRKMRVARLHLPFRYPTVVTTMSRFSDCRRFRLLT